MGRKHAGHRSDYVDQRRQRSDACAAGVRQLTGQHRQRRQPPQLERAFRTEQVSAKFAQHSYNEHRGGEGEDQQPAPPNPVDAGKINAGTYISGGGDLVRQNGKPRWKASGSLTWSLDQFQIGAFTQYTGSIDDTDLVDDDGNPWIVADQLTFNLYGQVTVGQPGERQFQFRLGARNLFDQAPPLSPDGYFASLYNPYGRYLYVNVRTTL